MLTLRSALKKLKKLKKLMIASQRSQERIRILEERILSLESSLFAVRYVEVEHFGSLLQPVGNMHRLARFGGEADGGYALPTDLEPPEVVISIGVGSECSVDDELARAGAQVIQFDHTVMGTPSTSPGVTFHRVGLSGSVPGNDTQPLSGLLQLANVPREANMWLMLDAEGVEWDLLADGAAPLDRFTVLNIEFHRLSWMMNDGKRSAAMMRGLEGLRRRFVPIAWHANNFAPAFAIGGKWVPDVLEVTFVSLSSFRPGETLSFGAHLRPNNPHSAELPAPFSEVRQNPYGPEIAQPFDQLDLTNRSG